MSTKSYLRLKPRRARQMARVGPHGDRARGPYDITLADPHGRLPGRAGVQADGLVLTRFAVQLPRRRGSWTAFGLAVAMHALLAAFLLFGMHWPKSTPVGARAVVTGRVIRPPLASPPPRITDQPMASLLTGQATQLVVAKERAPLTPHHKISKPLRTELEAQPTARSRIAPRLPTHMAGVRKAEQQVLTAV